LQFEQLTLWQGDCLELMTQIPDESIDLIATDLPFKQIKASWDKLIAFGPLWEQYERIIKPNRAICLNATQPFSSLLIASNPKLFRYEWIWNKVKPSNFLLSKIMPMMVHESVLVFGKGKVLYNPQMTTGRLRNKGAVNKTQFKGGGWGKVKFQERQLVNDQYYPKSIINISNANQRGKIIAAQKPVKLMEYIIKTYSNSGDLVLDSAMGSGSTGIACMDTQRKFLGMELDKDMFEKAFKRIKESAQHKE
jgi:site-specific DNA-methyltransferase (adenine-specific)